MSQSGRPPTIREVAALAGVSTATVSRAIRGNPNVDPVTRGRVEEAARTLRYRPSGVARSLKLRSTRTIGLIVTDIENPYFPQIVSAVEDAARERGYAVILADGRRDAGRELESLEVLAERQVDGLIIASSALTSRHRAAIRDLPCPVVIVNGESTLPAVPAVLSDDRAGGRLAGRHLIRLGHQRLAFLATAGNHSSAVGTRILGVRDALTEAGHDPRGLSVVQADVGVPGGESAARRALEASPRPSALVCANDVAAIGAIRGVRGLGLGVPGDISVVGYDDIEMAAYVDPPLTTVRQDTTAMGAWAMASLLGRIERGREDVAGDLAGRAGPTLRLPVAIVVRGSSGPGSP